MEAGGFLEWVEFLDYLQGTPIPDPPPGSDVLLEIDVQGPPDRAATGRSVDLRRHPLARSPGRAPASEGDDDASVAKRLVKADEEVEVARQLGAHFVVNDDLDRAVADVQRRSPRAPVGLAGMSWQHETMIEPPIEELFNRVGSKFRLVTLAAARGRQINSCLVSSARDWVPPSRPRSPRWPWPLSIAFEEIAADKIVAREIDPEEEAAAAAALAELDGGEGPDDEG